MKLMTVKSFALLLSMFVGSAGEKCAAIDLSEEELVIKVKVTLKGEIGIPRRNCRGLGTGCLYWDQEIIFEGQVRQDGIELGFETLSSDMLRLYFSYPKDVVPGSEPFIIEKDTPMKGSIASLLGFSSVILLPGEYKVSYKATDFSFVDVKVLTK